MSISGSNDNILAVVGKIKYIAKINFTCVKYFMYILTILVKLTN